MVYVIASALSMFIAAFLMFEAYPQRATLNWGQKNNVKRRLIRLGAALCAALSLWLLFFVTSVSRGISIWLAFAMTLTLVSLMVANWKPRVHHFSGATAGVALVAALITAVMGSV